MNDEREEEEQTSSIENRTVNIEWKKPSNVN